jgi:hypothetical protein
MTRAFLASYFKMSAERRSAGLSSEEAYRDGEQFGLRVRERGEVIVPEDRYPEEDRFPFDPPTAWFQGFMKGVRSTL